jgi:phage tail protein X
MHPHDPHTHTLARTHTRARAHTHTHTHTQVSLQQRFQGSISGLQRANPDIPDIHATMPTGTLVCILPDICQLGGY